MKDVISKDFDFKELSDHEVSYLIIGGKYCDDEKLAAVLEMILRLTQKSKDQEERIKRLEELNIL